MATLPIIVLCTYTIVCPLCYMDEEYPSWRYTKLVVAGKQALPVECDTVILGDSGAMSALIPTELSDTCVNLAVGGATSIEMYYFFKEYISQHDTPRNVVIMFAPFHYFNIDNYETRTMYFKSLSARNAIELYRNAQMCKADKVYYEKVIWDDLSCRLGLPTKYLPAINAAKFVGRYADNIRSYNALCDSRGQGFFGTSDGCDDASYECSYTGMVKEGEYLLIKMYLYKLLELCEKENINVILLQPALNETTYLSINENYVKEYTEYIEEIQEAFDNITCETALRCYDNVYFGDVSHLNAVGANKFSEEIRKTYSEIFVTKSQ